MTVSPVGTTTPTRATSGFTAATSSWTAGQTRTAGNLLLAVVSGGCTTVATWAVSENSSTWTQRFSLGNNAAGTSACGVAVFTKTATGGDAAPAFTTSLSGTGGVVVALWEFTGANTASPIDVSGIQQTGGTAGTVNFSTTTSANVTASGEYAISVFSQERSSSVLTWTETGTGWTSLFEDAVTSVSHTQINTQSNPTSGAALSDAGHFSTNTSGFGAAITFVLAQTPSFTSTGSIALAPMSLLGYQPIVMTGSVALAPMANTNSMRVPYQVNDAIPGLMQPGEAQPGDPLIVFGGNGSAALAPMGMSGTIHQAISASGSVALAPMSLTGATHDVGAAGGPALAPMALAGTVTQAIGCTGSVALAPMHMGGTNFSNTTSTGSLMLAAMKLHSPGLRQGPPLDGTAGGTITTDTFGGQVS